MEILNADSKVGRDGEDALRGLRANILHKLNDRILVRSSNVFGRGIGASRRAPGISGL